MNNSDMKRIAADELVQKHCHMVSSQDLYIYLTSA